LFLDVSEQQEEARPIVTVQSGDFALRTERNLLQPSLVLVVVVVVVMLMAVDSKFPPNRK
jgi:ABC-type enterobactin transport system permease subunit